MQKKLIIGVYGPIGVTDIGDIAILKENINFLYEITNKKISFKIFPLDSKTVLKQVLDLNAFKEDKIQIIKNIHLEKLWLNRDFSFKENIIRKEINSLRNGDFSKVYEENYIYDFKKCDGIFYLGGGYFNSNWKNFLYHAFIYPLYLAKYFRKIVFVSGINFGPFESYDFEIMKEIFPAVVSGVIVRDRHYSRKRLNSLGINKDKILDGVDDVFFLGELPELKKNREYMVVQLHLPIPNEFLKNSFIMKEIAKFLDYLVKTHKWEIIYMPFSTYLKADYYQGTILNDLMEEKKCFRQLKPTIDYKHMRSIIKGAKFVLATRFHPIVFATAEDVPCISIVKNELYRIKFRYKFRYPDTIL